MAAKKSLSTTTQNNTAATQKGAATQTAGQDAETLLKADHRKVEGLFAQYENASSAEEKAKIAKQVCKELIIHTKLEEEIFYPACREKDVEDYMLDEAQVEHDGAKVMISELIAGEPDGEFYDAKFTVLAEYIKHHVGEEEKPRDGIFAKAQKAGVDMTALGQKLQARKQELVGQTDENNLQAPKTRSLNFEDGQETIGMARYSDDRDDRGRFTSDNDRRGGYSSSSRGGYSSRSRDDDDRGGYSSRGGNRDRDDQGRFTSDGDNGRGSDSGYSSRGGNRDRDDQGRFTSDDDNGRGSRGGYSSRSRDYDDDRRGYGGAGRDRDDQGRFTSDGDSGRGSYARGRDDDDRYSGRNSGYRSGEGRGWYGDSEGHSQAAERGWESRSASRGDSSSRSRDYDDDRGGSRGGRGGEGHGGWFGDSRGHAEAARRGWQNRD